MPAIGETTRASLAAAATAALSYAATEYKRLEAHDGLYEAQGVHHLHRSTLHRRGAKEDLTPNDTQK